MAMDDDDTLDETEDFEDQVDGYFEPIYVKLERMGVPDDRDAHSHPGAQSPHGVH